MDKPDSEKAKQAELLEEDIVKLEQEISDKYYQLGKSVYEIADREVDEINHLVDRMIEIKQQLSDVKNQSICVHYMAKNPKSNRYCGGCGRKLQENGE